MSTYTENEESDAMSARDAYIREMLDAWRPKDVQVPTGEGAPAPKMQLVGAYPKGSGLKAGDPCTIDGAAGVLTEVDGWLVCKVKPVAPSRSSGDSMDARDQAWLEMCERQQNAWKGTQP